MDQKREEPKRATRTVLKCSLKFRNENNFDYSWKISVWYSVLRKSAWSHCVAHFLGDWPHTKSRLTEVVLFWCIFHIVCSRETVVKYATLWALFSSVWLVDDNLRGYSKLPQLEGNSRITTVGGWNESDFYDSFRIEKRSSCSQHWFPFIVWWHPSNVTDT